MVSVPSDNRTNGEREAFSYRADPSVPAFPDDKPVIIFDGHCVLCSGWATFVLTRDRRKHFRLLTAQSDLGRALYMHYGLDPQEYETNILLEDGIAHFRSAGSVRMAAGLGWPWRAARVFGWLPSRFADWAYDTVARNRLNWFGRRESCYLPAPDDADRFLS